MRKILFAFFALVVVNVLFFAKPTQAADSQFQCVFAQGFCQVCPESSSCPVFCAEGEEAKTEDEKTCNNLGSGECGEGGDLVYFTCTTATRGEAKYWCNPESVIAKCEVIYETNEDGSINYEWDNADKESLSAHCSTKCEQSYPEKAQKYVCVNNICKDCVNNVCDESDGPSFRFENCNACEMGFLNEGSCERLNESNQSTQNTFIFNAEGCEVIDGIEYLLEVRTPDGEIIFLVEINNGVSDVFNIFNPGEYTVALVSYTSLSGETVDLLWKTITIPEPTDEDEDTNTGGGSTDLTHCNSGGVDGFPTALGCIAFTSPVAIAASALGVGIGAAGGIALIMIAIAAFIISTSAGDPSKLETGKNLMFSALAGVILIITATLVLRVLGFSVLGLF